MLIAIEQELAVGAGHLLARAGAGLDLVDEAERGDPGRFVLEAALAIAIAVTLIWIVDMRRPARRMAAWLERVTTGKLHPDTVTLVGLLAHVPVAALIASGDSFFAGLLLAIASVLDFLDGELARLQGRSSTRGMLLDASTDRVEEVVIYCGIIYGLPGAQHHRITGVLVVATCGISLCVSYVKAKGEAVVAMAGMSHETVNRLFQVGVAGFDARKKMLVAGLVADQLTLMLVVISLLATVTVVQRLRLIMDSL